MMLIAGVFMVGGAGRDGGVNQIYITPHLANDFGYSKLTIGVLITAISAGSILGPVVFGWLSDRFSRVRMLQVSLALSCMGTLWVAHLGPGVAMLFVSGIFKVRTRRTMFGAASVEQVDRSAANALLQL